MTTRKTLNQDSIKIGQNLRVLRKMSGYSQGALADLLGVSHQQIQKYETGINRLPLQTMPLLCDVLGVKTEDFLQGIKPRAAKSLAAAGRVHRSIVRMEDRAMRQKIVQIVDILVA